MKESKGTKGYLSILAAKIETIESNKEKKEAEIERLNDQ